MWLWSAEPGSRGRPHCAVGENCRRWRLSHRAVRPGSLAVCTDVATCSEQTYCRVMPGNSLSRSVSCKAFIFQDDGEL